MRSPHLGQGSNSANVRRYNERLLLKTLRRAGSASKADLARLANLTGTAVGSIIASLAEAKLIEFAGRRAEGQRGQPASLIRLDPRGAFGIGVRLDRMVTAARLRLTYTYSPSLVFPVSHLKVSINGEAVATLPFDSEHAGRAVTQEIPLDARYFTDFNQIELRLIAHYTLDHCEDPEHSALWADVSPTSELIFDEASVRLPNDLALLPAPFFDRRDNSRLRLPFVLPATPDDATLRSAGVLAAFDRDGRRLARGQIAGCTQWSDLLVVLRVQGRGRRVTPLVIPADAVDAAVFRALCVLGRRAARGALEAA